MPTFAEQMVAKYEALLLASAGSQRVVVDGVEVFFADLEKKYRHWQRQVARENGSRPAVANISLEGGGVEWV